MLTDRHTDPKCAACGATHQNDALCDDCARRAAVALSHDAKHVCNDCEYLGHISVSLVRTSLVVGHLPEVRAARAEMDGAL